MKTAPSEFPLKTHTSRLIAFERAGRASPSPGARKSSWEMKTPAVCTRGRKPARPAASRGARPLLGSAVSDPRHQPADRHSRQSLLSSIARERESQETDTSSQFVSLARFTRWAAPPRSLQMAALNGTKASAGSGRVAPCISVVGQRVSAALVTKGAVVVSCR